MSMQIRCLMGDDIRMPLDAIGEQMGMEPLREHMELIRERMKPVDMAPFDDLVIDYLEAVSSAIRKDRDAAQGPGLKSFGFWCRRAHILQMKKQYQSQAGKNGLGLLFHICPSNVPGLFAWSAAIGLLTGNVNIVRVSGRAVDEAVKYCSYLAKVMNEERFAPLRDRLIVVTYPSEAGELTAAFSDACDGRIIWGGDRSIEAITKNHPMKNKVDIAFPDRVSAAIFDSAYVMELSDEALEFQAKLFCDDTYALDQNACSSPSLIFWLGEAGISAKISERWWKTLARVTENVHYDDKIIYDKYTNLCEMAMALDLRKVTWEHSALCHVPLGDPTGDWADWHLAGGAFLEYRIEKLEELSAFDHPKWQTLVCLGVSGEEVHKIKEDYAMEGILRTCALGQALEMDLMWDGKNLASLLTRKI